MAALHPTGLGLTLAIVSMVLLCLSWVTAGARIIVRSRLRATGIDDWLMVAGLMFYTLACQATITAAYRGVGAHADRITDYYDREGRKWFFFFQLFYVASTVPIKAAICVALLRIATQRIYKYMLYGIIILSSIAALTTDIAVLAWCKPVSATWDKSLGTCADAAIITNVSYFISACSIITDWSCAILPAFILWNVQLRFRIKASVAVVLALGVFASSATLIRLRYLLNYNNPSDYLYGIANIAIWSIIESGIGIIAGSLPALRPLLKYIPFIGSSTTGSHGHKSTGPHGGTSYGNRSYHQQVDSIPMDGLNTRIEANKKNWEELSDAESQKYILKDTHITVTNEASGAVRAGSSATSN